MIDDPYLAMAAGAQALRRRIERQALGLGGALGVAAEPYPHQLATVRRILGDTRIRHLIADEVGLGKTVEALMVLNALRLQDTNHSTVIVAPDRLIDQWQSECWTRCHVQASVFDDNGEPDGRVQLVRPQSLISGTYSLDPVRSTLLIVDEPQTMPVAALEIIERLSADFRQFVLLSATPGLGDPTRRLQLMRMLEPERVAAAELSGEDPVSALDRLDAEAAYRSDISSAALFSTWCRSRRVIRATRKDWGRYLPERRYGRTDAAPLDTESLRISNGMQWAREDAEPSLNLSLFAQALHRSPSSARRAMRRQPKSNPRLIAAIEAAAAPGDSRLDALIDRLRDIWSEDHSAQVVVVAGDTPTIDHLQSQLPRYLGSDQSPLVVASLRRAAEAQESEVDDIRVMQEEMSAFISGSARVLLIGDWIQAGLNLQHFSGHIIFHNPPWDPQTIDQLIGRLDRLRPGALARGDQGRVQKPVSVWTICQKGTPGALIVDALEALDIFKRPMPPTGPEVQNAIDRGLGTLIKTGNAKDVVLGMRVIRAAWSEGGDRSPLELRDPWTPASAQAAYDKLRAHSPLEPVMEREKRGSFFQRREEGLRGFTDLITKMRLFEVAGRNDANDPKFSFSTIWYAGRPDTALIRLNELDTGRTFIAGHQPFIWKRTKMTGVPRRLVQTDTGEENGRPLRFLDDGDTLHDGLIDLITSVSGQSFSDPLRPAFRIVRVPEAHPMLAFQGKILLLCLANLDPADLMPPLPLELLRQDIDAAPTDRQRADLTLDLAKSYDGWRADQRWISLNVAASLVADLSVYENSVWTPVLDDQLIWAAFKPFVEGNHTVFARSSSAGQQGSPPPLVARAVQEAARRSASRTAATFNAAADALVPLLKARAFQLTAEGDDLMRLRALEVERRRGEPAGNQEQFRAGRIAGAERREAFAKKLIQARADCLMLARDRLRDSRPAFRTLLIRPVAYPI
jgi:ATP-dependent helicase HepA